MPADMQPSTQMACCDHDKPDCGQAMKAADCCGVHGDAPDRTLAPQPVAPHTSTVNFVPVTLAASIVPTPTVMPVSSGLPSIAASPPIFLLGAVFRI